MGIAASLGTAARNPALQAGALLGGVAAVASFTPSLMPRPMIDQSLLTGASMLTGFGVGVAAHGAAGALSTQAARMGASPALARIAGPVAVAGAGGAALLAARPREQEGLQRAAVRTAGTTAMLGAGAAAAVVAGNAARTVIAGRLPAGRVVAPALVGAAVLGGGGAALTRNLELSRRAHGGEPGIASAAAPIAIGLAAAATIGGAVALHRAGAEAVARGLASRLPGPAAAWKVAGHAAVLGTIGAAGAFGGRVVVGSLERANDKVEPAFAGRPSLSTVTSGPGSDVPPSALGRHGRRFVGEAIPATRISEVTGAPATDPIRVYVGTPAAAGVQERVGIAMAELERTGAFERAVLILASPSGTGFVNPIPIAAAEYMARGDVATVAMQYGARPSVISADRVSTGAEQNASLLRAIHDRLATMPQSQRPRLVMYGESLGAHTSQDVFLHGGTDAVEQHGVDRALWTGTPYRSKWRHQVLDQERPDVQGGLVGEFNSIEGFRALPKPERDRLRVVLLTHDNDPVSKFGADLLVQRPAWLGNERPATVPAEMSWMPGISFLQGLFDAKNAATVVPGRFDADGHDYRADLTPFVREAYRFDHVDDGELDRIVEALVADEKRRSEQLGG